MKVQFSIGGAFQNILRVIYYRIERAAAMEVARATLRNLVIYYRIESFKINDLNITVYLIGDLL